MAGPEPPPLPPDLPEPHDDGATEHLPGSKVPPITLPATTGDVVALATSPTSAVVFCYPRMGHPGDPPVVAHWDRIPGARGCTPEACGFRDIHAEFTAAGFEVYGVSTQEPAAQREAADRLALPFPLLSDAELELTRAWRLPVFELAGNVFLKRLTMLLQDGAVRRVWYPVFPPDRHAVEVLDTLKGESRPSEPS